MEVRTAATAEDEEPLAVLLADDHRVFTDALRISLDRTPGIRCTAVGHSVAEATALIDSSGCDVAVVDLELPDGSGLSVVEHLARRHRPGRCIVLTAHLRPDLARRAIAAGAVGFLGKDGTLPRIVEAVRYASPDNVLVDVDTSPAQADLTMREHQVLGLLGQGLDPATIAADLRISLHTTRDHIKSIKAKLGVHSLLAAVIAAGRQGLISVGSRI
ncbi:MULTISPECIES: response regulator transcription factor [unclassified Pseudonocardia]|uniref:response regulator transcription factor n=1 Tax=unclassified Pseudonocardia TaxID=2619320 RepID=UPI0007612EEA|nr:MULTISPECIES: response regulator transcription factor [unclassified Pseudonocardia]